MAQNQSSNDPLENLVQATAEVGKRFEEKTTEVLEVASEHVREGASNASASFNDARANLADKTLEKTADNTKQDVIDTTVAKGQPNVAVAYTVATEQARTESASLKGNLSDDQHAQQMATIQKYIDANASKQTSDIAQENVQVARLEQQRIQAKNQELTA